jgi:AcrR family transcriptional regulator
MKSMASSNRRLIWERLDTPPKSHKLDYDRIIRVAMSLADQKGIEAVSMRNIADVLKVGAMSLYRYVEGKEDLLDLILDAAYGEISLPEASQMGWRETFHSVAIESRRVMRSHPWLATLVSRRPTLGPKYLKWFEYLLASSAATGCGMEERIQMIGTVWAYISGFIAYELGEMETERRHNLTPAKKRRIAKPYVSALLARGEHPHLAEFIQSDLGRPDDTAFANGLEIVLNGIEVYVSDNVNSSGIKSHRRRSAECGGR